MAAPSWQELYDIFKAELVAQRPDLKVNDGDITDMLGAGGASMGDWVIGYLNKLFKDTYVDGAREDALTTLADDHWGIERLAASSATATVTFTRSSSVASTDIPAGTRVATAKDTDGNEIVFVVDDDTTLGIGTLSSAIPCTAEEPGLAGNVAAATIIRVLDVLDQTFTCTNAAAAAGGSAEETDDELRDRIRGFNSTLRRGTIAALEYGARTVAGVKFATASEDSGGATTVFVSDADGNSTAGMVSDVEDELENWRAAGSVVNVTGGTVYTLTPITITLTVRTGVDVAAITANVKSAIKARLDKLKIGEVCQRAIIAQAALNVDIDNITGCVVVAPGADVTPTSSQVIRTTTSDISVS